jgi:hypothetical protein
MAGGTDFADVDPVEFLFSERKTFFHKCKKYAQRVILDRTDREILSYTRVLASELNSYRLVLACRTKKMPDKRSKQLLEELLVHMDKAWNERNTLMKEMVPLADKILTSYEGLVDYLKSATQRT